MNRIEAAIAWRYLRTRRREKFISVTAVFSFIGIALGVATLIIVTSVMNGFREEFSSKIVGFNGHLTAYIRNANLDVDDTVNKIESMSGVVSAIPVIERHALSSNGRQIRGAMVCGISKNDLKKYKLVSEGIVHGQLNEFGDESIIIGNSLADIFNSHQQSDVTILTPEMDETGLGMFPIKKTFKLVATFKSGMHEYDSSAAIIPLEMAQKLFNIEGASNILIFAKNDTNLRAIKDDIVKTFGANLHVVDWLQNNSAFMNAVKVERNVMFLILTLITLVASFNIISCMIMMVKDKERDIAILKTLGFTNSAIMRIFFMIGSAIGVLGTLLGAICGVLFSLNIDSIKRGLEYLLSINLFQAEVYFLTELPSVIHYSDVAVVVLCALFISCLATIYPSIKASKLSPAEVLKYE